MSAAALQAAVGLDNGGVGVSGGRSSRDSSSMSFAHGASVGAVRRLRASASAPKWRAGKPQLLPARFSDGRSRARLYRRSGTRTKGGVMAVRVAINGFGRTGRAAFRAAVESGADIEWVAVNDVADPAMLAQLLKYDTVYGPFAGTVEAADGAIVVNGVPDRDADGDRPGRTALGRSRRRRRDRVERALSRPCGRREAPAGGGEEGDRLGARQGAGRHGRARRQLRDLRSRRAQRHLECVVHDELPRTGREGAARGARLSPRRDDDGARVHRRPAAARRAAQGLPARTRGGCEPRADLDRSGEGDRARRSRPRRASSRASPCGCRCRRARSST